MSDATFKKDEALKEIDLLSFVDIGLKPRYDRMVVIQDAVSGKTASLIITNTATKELPVTGVVVALSEKAKEEGFALADRVQFSNYAGQEVTHLGITYASLKTTDIFAVVTIDDVEYESRIPFLLKALAKYQLHTGQQLGKLDELLTKLKDIGIDIEAEIKSDFVGSL